MAKSSDLTNHLLIAMPNLQDPFFYHTVTYICEHNEKGAIGIIINKPIEVQLDYVFQQMEISVQVKETEQLPVLYGGPIQQERGFILHRPIGKWRSSLVTSNEIAVTTSQDILKAVANGTGPDDILVALGYAGWNSKQLEQEISNNTWLVCQSKADILFNIHFAKRWEAAAKLLGIDINQLSGDVGHA